MILNNIAELSCNFVFFNQIYYKLLFRMKEVRFLKERSPPPEKKIGFKG